MLSGFILCESKRRTIRLSMLVLVSTIFLVAMCSALLPTQHGISVWDGVLASTPLVEGSLDGLGLAHFVYDRKRRPTNVVEGTLEEILNELGDDAPYVEFWSRADWINLELHKDIDEFRAKRTDDGWSLKYPQKGHVLYVNVGDEVQGPTLVFDHEFKHMVSVPAKTGRLLRFDGDAPHAVPRPALAFLDPDEGGSNLEIFSRVRDEAIRFPSLKRRVLLFNTWQERPEQLEEMQSEGPPSQVSSSAVSFSMWSPVPVGALPTDGESLIRLKVLLLGDRRRRLLRPDSSSVDFLAPRCVKQILQANDAVGVVPLKMK